MAQDTDTDIRELKDLITGLREETRLGFTKLEGKMDGLNDRLTAVESRVSGLDARLWGFGATLLTAVLAALLAIFNRFLFTGTP